MHQTCRILIRVSSPRNVHASSARVYKCICIMYVRRITFHWADLAESVGQLTCASLSSNGLLAVGTSVGRVLILRLPSNKEKGHGVLSSPAQITLANLALILKAPFDRLDAVSSLSISINPSQSKEVNTLIVGFHSGALLVLNLFQGDKVNPLAKPKTARDIAKNLWTLTGAATEQPKQQRHSLPDEVLWQCAAPSPSSPTNSPNPIRVERVAGTACASICLYTKQYFWKSVHPRV